MTDAGAILDAYLDAVENPGAGEALHALLAAEAPWPYRREVRAAGTIARDEFAENHQAIGEAHAESAPGAARPPVLADRRVLAVEEEDRTAVVWLAAREAETGRELLVAAGLRREGEAWRVGWATLAEARAPWRYSLGLAQTVADFPFTGAIAPRSWLDCAFRRLYDHERPNLLVLPEARFACHASSTCCKVDYAIEIDPAFQRVIDAIPWERTRPELAGTQLPLLPNGKLEVKQNGADCRFLDADRRCSVHAALGRAVFPPCARFPFAFVETPDGVAVSASSLCGSVRDRLGPPLLDRSADLYQRMAIAREAVVRQTAFLLTPGREVPWEEYREAEAALLGYLGRNALPLHRRLWLGSALLANWAKGFRTVPPELEGVPIAVAPEAQREAVRVLLFDFLRFFGLPTVPEVARVLGPGQDLRLAAMLRNMLFSKLSAMAFDLTTAHNMGVLLYLLVLHLEAANEGSIGERQWEALGRIFFHGGIHAALQGAEAADYRAMFGDAEFGLWLLSYPLEAPCADS